jgi:hypothetical protein
MRLVVQNEKCGAYARRLRAGAAVLAAAAVASGCTLIGDTTRGNPAPEREKPLQAPEARALDGYASRLRTGHAARAAAARRWGLEEVPLQAPPPPARKPRITTREGFEVTGHDELGLPPAFTTDPPETKVVFLPFDNGTEKNRPSWRLMT